MGLWAHTGRTPHTIIVANSDEWLSCIAIGVTLAAMTYSQPESGRLAGFARAYFTRLIESASPPRCSPGP